MGLADEWEAQAGTWADRATSPDDSYARFHRDAFLSLLPPPGRLTLDVGCGEGRLPRDLAARGHRVVGLDLSVSMVRNAVRAAGGPLGYLVADAASVPIRSGCVDLAVAFMSLHDMDEISAACRELARVLAPGGRLGFAISHPLNTAKRQGEHHADGHWEIGRGAYFGARRISFSSQRDGATMTFHSMHRPMTEYFAALEDAGMVVESVREPRDGGAAGHLPWFLHVRARKD